MPRCEFCREEVNFSPASTLHAFDHAMAERQRAEKAEAERNGLARRIEGAEKHLQEAELVCLFAQHGGGKKGSAERRWAEMKAHFEKARAALKEGDRR